MLKYFKVFAFVLATQIAFANGTGSGTFEGIVTDKTTGEALAGAKVTVVETGKVVYTDFDGKFTLEGIAEGATYTFEISSLGYEDMKGNVLKVKEEKCVQAFGFTLTEK